MKGSIPPAIRFRESDGFLQFAPEHRAGYLDHILGFTEEGSDERRMLLMDHRLLATLADFECRYDLYGPAAAQDEYGVVYVALKRGGRAYDLDDYEVFLRREFKYFNKLTAAVRTSLFERFVDDAIDAVGDGEAAV